MSLKAPIDLKQDRREWLKTSATMLGAAVLPLAGAAGELSGDELQAGQATGAAKPAAGTATKTKVAARFFTPAQHASVEEFAETIIPADSRSGGAKAAKVADFIEQTLRESVDEKQKAAFREGLRLVELMSQHYNGKSFVESSAEERVAVVRVLADNEHMTELPEVAFFGEMKRLTVRGYYTSKIGIHDELNYQGNRILMEFVGCDDPTPPRT